MTPSPKSVVEQADAGSVTVDAPPTGYEAPHQDRGFFGHPRGLSTLFFTEMWERFSFYGIRPMLIAFMIVALTQGGMFGFDRETAGSILGIYAASVYLTSLPGGWIADRWLGLRRAIWYGGLLIALGHISVTGRRSVLVNWSVSHRMKSASTRPLNSAAENRQSGPPVRGSMR